MKARPKMKKPISPIRINNAPMTGEFIPAAIIPINSSKPGTRYAKLDKRYTRKAFSMYLKPLLKYVEMSDLFSATAWTATLIDPAF